MDHNMFPYYFEIYFHIYFKVNSLAQTFIKLLKLIFHEVSPVPLLIVEHFV